jgi:hypothetical protein
MHDSALDAGVPVAAVVAAAVDVAPGVLVAVAAGLLELPQAAAAAAAVAMPMKPSISRLVSFSVIFLGGVMASLLAQIISRPRKGRVAAV